MINKAKWIWENQNPQPNEYAEFLCDFEFCGSTAKLFISAESDYIAEINRATVSFGQFSGYLDKKYFDELDITDFCQKGKNTLKLTVRYEGIDTACRIKDRAGVIFWIEQDGEPIAQSTTDTQCALSESYVQHTSRLLSYQLGLSSDMKTGQTVDFHPAVEAPIEAQLLPRPTKKLIPQPTVNPTLINPELNIYDLGRETVAYLSIKITTPADCRVNVAYGEHIKDGEVRRIIGHRDFSLEFHCKAGENAFTNYFSLMGLRYLQISAAGEFKVEDIKVLPVLYDVRERKAPKGLSPLDTKIYETARRTLHLCMYNHYTDCPYREQALYILDSRNQMLCGYYAFHGFDYPRANLTFMAQGLAPHGLLELTFPAQNTPSIPFFSVMYPVAVWEYIKYSGDTSILEEVMPAIKSIMSTVKQRISPRGLIADFEPPFWNFYEWSEFSDNSDQINGRDPRPEQFDLILNCAVVYAFEKALALAEMVNEEIEFDTNSVKTAIETEFFNPDSGLFHVSTAHPDKFNQLGNAFALLIGLGDDRTAEALVGGSLIPATLSMSGYIYDALLTQNTEYKDYILNDIRQRYGMMLDADATSFWETEDGPDCFEGSGSLCHGWSAMPIYYYNIFI